VDYAVKQKKRNVILNDSMGDGEFYSFLLSAFKNMATAMAPGAGIYICHGDCERFNFQKAMVNAGLEQKECLIWVKNSLVLTRQDYHWRHEPILYGWKPGAAHKWYADRKQTTVIDAFPCLQIVPLVEKKGFHVTVSTAENHVSFECSDLKVLESFTGDKSSVWYFNRPTSSLEHPTMKPVELIVRALNNSSKRGDIVLDLFGGSGSTLIAAEHTGRLAYLCELSPIFVDVIIKRWENATGKKAVKL
jgi:DNA modification methylase